MDLEAFVTMYGHSLGGAFAASEEGQKAFADFAQLFDAFSKAYDRDSERQKGESLRLQATLAQNNKRYSVSPYRRPVIPSFNTRRFRAKHDHEVWRALSVGDDRAKRFAWQVKMICEDGEVVLDESTGDYLAPEVPWNPEREWTPEVERYFAITERERRAQKAGAHIAHRAQAAFRARNVPMNFSVGVGLLYYELAGDYVNDVEKPFVHALIHSAAQGHGYAFLPQSDVVKLKATYLQYGLLVEG